MASGVRSRRFQLKSRRAARLNHSPDERMPKCWIGAKGNSAAQVGHVPFAAGRVDAAELYHLDAGFPGLLYQIRKQDAEDAVHFDV